MSWLVLACPHEPSETPGTRLRALVLACLAKGRGAEGDPQGGALGKKFRGAAAGCVGDFPRRKALAPFGYASPSMALQDDQQARQQRVAAGFAGSTPKAHCAETGSRLSRLVLLYYRRGIKMNNGKGSTEHKKSSPSSETAIGNFFDTPGGLEALGQRPSQARNGKTLLDERLSAGLTPSCANVILNSASLRRTLSMRGALTPKELLRIAPYAGLHDGIILVGSVSSLTSILLDLAAFNIE